MTPQHIASWLGVVVVGGGLVFQGFRIIAAVERLEEEVDRLEETVEVLDQQRHDQGVRERVYLGYCNEPNTTWPKEYCRDLRAKYR